MTAVPADAAREVLVVVDLDRPVTLTDCHLVAEFGYQDPGPVVGWFVTTEPFPVSLRLDGLLPS